MKIKSYSLGQLQANCYLIINDDNNCLMIDPADEASFLLEEIKRKRLKLQAVFATHGHFDHLMAAGEIQLSLPNVPFYISKKDLFLLKRLNETAEYFLSYNPHCLLPKNIYLIKKKKFKIFGFEFEVIKTPGHTPGSVCFYFKKQKFLFSGDTFFNEGIGRYDFSYSRRDDLFNSLKKIIRLPDEVVVYPGHGEVTTIKSARNFFISQRLF